VADQKAFESYRESDANRTSSGENQVKFQSQGHFLVRRPPIRRQCPRFSGVLALIPLHWCRAARKRAIDLLAFQADAVLLQHRKTPGTSSCRKSARQSRAMSLLKDFKPQSGRVPRRSPTLNALYFQSHASSPALSGSGVPG